MELKLTNQPLEDTTEASLNRTFYGIETGDRVNGQAYLAMS